MVQYGSNIVRTCKDKMGARKGTKQEERTWHQGITLGKYRSPNRDWELSTGEHNGWEMEARELT